jgi:protein-disulfide isomerase
MIVRRTFVLGAAAVATGAALPAAADEGDTMTIGSARARHELVEYASAICPHCAEFHRTNWARLKADYIDRGRLRYTLHEMLTPPPAVALGMFQLARCQNTDPHEYMRRLGIMFERQHDIIASGTMVGVRDSLVALGGEWALTQDQVMACLTDQNGVTRIQRSIDEATARGVTGTPTFFLDGTRVDDPAFHTPDGMAQILDAALRRRR